MKRNLSPIGKDAKARKRTKNKEAESQQKTERKQNLKRKQEAWKLQVQKAKRQKVNPPNVQEEDDEKQQEVDEDDNNQENGLELEVAPVDNGEFLIVIDNAEKRRRRRSER